MATQTTNRISVDVTTFEIQSAKDHLGKLNNIFNYAIGLTPEERTALPKIDVVNNVFVDDALMAGLNNPNILPAYLNLEELKKDKTGYDRLDEIVQLMSQLTQKLRDTQLLMGSEAYVTALTIYRLFESAARDGVPGADAIYKQLAERFKSQGQPAKPDTTGETSTPSAQ